MTLMKPDELHPFGVRGAASTDLAALTEIYNHYIENSNSTFVTEPISTADRKPWLDRYLGDNPYCLLVAEQAGTVVGFASVGPYRTDQGFEQTVETAIYVSPSETGRGFGSLLYGALFGAIIDLHFHRAVAGIALPNDASVALHRKFGFEEVGVFSEYAVKWGSYISSMWMQKRL